MLYHMKIVFSIDTSNPWLNNITEHLDGNHVVTQNAGLISIEQTVPFIPDKKVLDSYAKVIKKNYTQPDLTIENVRFLRYDFIEPITDD